MKKITILLFMMLSLNTMAQTTDTTLIEKLMRLEPEHFSGILRHPQNNQVQILYTQVVKNKNLPPLFRSYSYHVNPQQYFYPASTVKLAAVIFALEKINQLKVKGLSSESAMITDSAYVGQTPVNRDSTAKNGLPSIAHYIKKILLTSDNDAFNRLYEFIGRAEINQKLKKYGFDDSRILNRLAIGDSGEPAKHTNPIRFYNGQELAYTQAAQYDPKAYPLTLKGTTMGVGYMDSTEHLVNKPFDLSNKNAFSLQNQQSMMKRLMYPNAFPAAERFDLKPSDYELIYNYMNKLPTESDYPAYDPKEFWPTYAKMLYYGREKGAKINPDLKIFNKYGDSYGYIIDNAYFKDEKHHIEFFLSAVVQSNEDGIYNDGKYEYDSVCFPFMKNLGRMIYAYEKAQQAK